MVKKYGKIALCLCIFGVFWNSAFATIIVSGDANIVYPLDSQYKPGDKPYNPDNKTFFTNVLESGDHVAVLNQLGISNEKQLLIDSFYDDLLLMTSTIIQSISDNALADIDMLVVALPDNQFLDDELEAMRNFHQNGGSIFFLGDCWTQANVQNGYINLALEALKSDMRIDDDRQFDAGVFVAPGSMITTHPLTAGVASLTSISR